MTPPKSLILRKALLLVGCFTLAIPESHAVVCITAPQAPQSLQTPCYQCYFGPTNITIGNINRTSLGDEIWADINTTNQSGKLTQNTAYSLSFTHDDLWNSQVRAWIDYNNDGDFLDAGELLGTSVMSPGLGVPYTDVINFTSSASATGWKNMRVVLDYDDGFTSIGAPLSDKCWYGEVEDYQVNLVTSAAMTYSSCTATQSNTSTVYQGSTNEEVIGVQIVAGTGGASPITATSFTFQTTGTTNVTDISNARLWTTASSCNFATATQLGGTVASPPASGTPFTINGFTFTLASGTNYFWLTYDVSPTAVSGNVMDAQCTSLIAGGSSRTPTTTAPAGSRPISDGFTSAVTTQSYVAVIGAPSTDQQIVGLEVTIAASSLNATSFTFNTTGSTNASLDITSASLWYTGNSSTFGTTTQYGSAVAGPNGSFSFTGSTALAAGTHYFWLTYTISGSGNPGDKVDAQCTSLTVQGVAHTPTPTSPAGDRTIVAFNTGPQYPVCIARPAGPQLLQTLYNYFGLTNVTLNTINRTSLGDELWACVDTTNQGTKLTQSTAYVLSFTHDDMWGVKVRAWIDYNSDGDFLDAGELLGTSALSPGLGTSYTSVVNFTASASATGWKNLRITMDYDDGATSIGAPVSDKCWYGEAEDYQVNIATSAAMAYTSCTTTQSNTSVVYQGSANQQVIGVEIVNGTGGASPITATSFTFQTTGTTSVTDISNAKLWTTRSGCNFAATTQLGTTIASPPASGTPFTFSGFTFTLAPGTNYFWITYDISPTAVVGNVIDAQCTSLIAGGSSRTPTSTSPAGSRPISDGFTSAVTTQPNTGVVGVSAANQLIVGVEVTIAANTLSATSFTFNTTGSTNALNDIASASLWYTGTSMTFTASTQYGSTVMAPNGSFSFTGSVPLAPGKYYFWLTYTISGSATPGDKVDAQCTSLTLQGLAHTPTPTSPAGDRTIVATASIPLQYQATYGTTADEDGLSFDIALDGGYIINGRFNSDCVPCISKEQGWMFKIDAGGLVQWSNRFGGVGNFAEEGRGVMTTPDGYVIAGETTSNTNTQWDMFFSKFNTVGTMVWCKSYGLTNAGEGSGTSVWNPIFGTTASDGGYLFTGGASNSSATNISTYLLKTATDGTLQWGAMYGGGGGIGYSVQQTCDGGFITAASGGVFPNPIGPGFLNSFYLAKANSAGTFQWGKAYGNTLPYSSSEPHELRVTSDGGFLVLGSASGYTPLPPAGSNNNVSYNDLLLVKVSSDGILQWNKTYGTTNSQYGTSLCPTADGGYIISGYGRPPGGFGFYNDAMLIKIDAAGNVQWSKIYGGALEDRALRVLQTSDGGYAFTGYTKSSGGGGLDIWFVKTNEVGETGVNACNFQSVSINVGTLQMNLMTGGSGSFRTNTNTNTISAGLVAATPNIVCQIVLPMELLDFTASLLPDNQVACNWITGSETYNDYFVVEHSIDGNAFTHSGVVQGAGNSTAKQHYSFTDEHPSPGINYYRLKQVDFDGKYTYSKTVSVDIPVFPYALTIFPNPSGKQLNCIVSPDQNTTVVASVVDMMGETVMSMGRKLSAGKNNLIFDISDLPQGLYFLVVNDGVKQRQLKFVKE